MLPMSMSEFADANCSCSASMSSLVITRRGFAPGLGVSCATAGEPLVTGVVPGPAGFPEYGCAAAVFGLSRSGGGLWAEGLGFGACCGLLGLGGGAAGAH